MSAKLEAFRKLILPLAMSAAAGMACGKNEPIAAEPAPSAGGTGGSDDAKADAPPATACATGLAGAPLVRIPAPDGSYYCMDQREVTYGEYGAFLESKKGDVSGQPSECNWNTSFVPDFTDPGNDQPPPCPEGAWNLMLADYPGYPAGCVDFCDALAYCNWAGKRLCGEIGASGAGVNMKSDDAADKLGRSTASEWYNACSQGGTTKYPYGDQYVSGRCKDSQQSDVTNTSNNECTGSVPGYQGVFDLSGSVEEWVNFCTLDGCAHYGGSFISTSESNLSCERFGLLTASRISVATGFRCCADAVPEP